MELKIWKNLLEVRKHVCSNCNTKFFDFNKEKLFVQTVKQKKKYK